jgi:hypothetical protein
MTIPYSLTGKTTGVLFNKGIPARGKRAFGYILDLFNNPAGYFTSLAVFQAKAVQNRFF